MYVAAIGAIAIGESPEAAVVVFLFAVGELLEGVAASRARAGVKALVHLMPRSVRRIRGDDVETVPASELAVGDVVLVRPGDRVPSDGTVVEGASELNEAPITGESRAVFKEVGSSVYAGSVNGELRVSITKTAADNTIARIVHMIEEAQATKAPTARFIERFSRWYTPAAMAFALLVIVAPPRCSRATTRGPPPRSRPNSASSTTPSCCPRPSSRRSPTIAGMARSRWSATA